MAAAYVVTKCSALAAMHVENIGIVASRRIEEWYSDRRAAVAKSKVRCMAHNNENVTS